MDKYLFPEQSRNGLGETVLVTVFTVVFVQTAEQKKFLERLASSPADIIVTRATTIIITY